MEGFVSRVVGRRLSQRRVAALGAGLLGVELGAAVELRVPSPGRVLVQMAGRNRCAASPPQGLLLSLGVEGHLATVTTSGQDRPEGGDRRIQSGSLWSLRFLKMSFD